jgi:hypothetical protein
MDCYLEGEHGEGMMYSEEKLERRDGLPPYDETWEREKEAVFDPARQVKVVDERGHVRILNKSWAWAVARKAEEEESKRPWLKDKVC